MSAYREYQTQMNDEKCLIATLKQCGYKPRATKKKVGSLTLSTVVADRLTFNQQENGTFNMGAVDEYGKRLNEITSGYAENKAMELAAAKGLVFSHRESTKTAEGTRTRLVFKPVIAGR